MVAIEDVKETAAHREIVGDVREDMSCHGIAQHQLEVWNEETRQLE